MLSTEEHFPLRQRLFQIAVVRTPVTQSIWKGKAFEQQKRSRTKSGYL
jgi:hypothetical protein